MANGTKIDTKLGKNTVFIMLIVVTCPPIQSIVVVTSPMGDQAPPALQATIIIPAITRRCSGFRTNLRATDTITMAVVRLSNKADKTNDNPLIIQSSVRVFRLAIRSVMSVKPSCASMSSTTVMAPSKKNRISAVWPKFSVRCSPTGSPDGAISA